MLAQEAVALLRRMQYKPDTRLSFYAYNYGEVEMSMEFKTYNSTPSFDGRQEPGWFYAPPIVLKVDDLNAEEVLASALNAIIEVEIHEAREFWRIRNVGAPFHPHNMEGERNWNRSRGIIPRVMYPGAHDPKHIPIA